MAKVVNEMSNHDNPRRGEKKRTETGPRWENPNPGKGSNSTHVARSRKKWKKRARRRQRRGEEGQLPFGHRTLPARGK